MQLGTLSSAALRVDWHLLRLLCASLSVEVEVEVEVVSMVCVHVFG
jgi:hypothetical protein